MVKIALALAYDDITRHPCYTHDCAHRALQYHVCEVYDRFSELTKYATPFERPVSPYELMRDVAETAKVRGEGCTDLDEMLWSQGVDNAGELKNNISYEILNDQSYIKPYIPMVDTFDPNDYVSAKKDLLNNAKKDAHDSAYLYDTT